MLLQKFRHPSNITSQKRANRAHHEYHPLHHNRSDHVYGISQPRNGPEHPRDGDGGGERTKTRPSHYVKKSIEEPRQHGHDPQDSHHWRGQRLITSGTSEPLDGVFGIDCPKIGRSPDAALWQYHYLQHAGQQVLYVGGNQHPAADRILLQSIWWRGEVFCIWKHTVHHQENNANRVSHQYGVRKIHGCLQGVEMQGPAAKTWVNFKIFFMW